MEMVKSPWSLLALVVAVVHLEVQSTREFTWIVDFLPWPPLLSPHMNFDSFDDFSIFSVSKKPNRLCYQHHNFLLFLTCLLSQIWEKEIELMVVKSRIASNQPHCVLRITR